MLSLRRPRLPLGTPTLPGQRSAVNKHQTMRQIRRAGNEPLYHGSSDSGSIFFLLMASLKTSSFIQIDPIYETLQMIFDSAGDQIPAVYKNQLEPPNSWDNYRDDMSASDWKRVVHEHEDSS